MNALTANSTIRVAIAGESLRGKGRELNEDSLSFSSENGWAVVADGIGGFDYGELASRVATRALAAGLQDCRSLAEDDEILRSFQQMFRQAHAEVSALAARTNGRAPGTTATCALVSESKLYVKGVGDSHAYLLRNERLKPLTSDNAWVEFMIRIGGVSRQQARQTQSSRGMLDYLGKWDLELSEVVAVQSLLPHDRILLSTDGITSVLTEEDLVAILSSAWSPETAISGLVAAAQVAGSTDDLTAVCLFANPS